MFPALPKEPAVEAGIPCRQRNILESVARPKNEARTARRYDLAGLRPFQSRAYQKKRTPTSPLLNLI